MAVEVFNPIQGGLAVGIGGMLFYIGSLLWFYIGRLRCDEALLNKIFWVIIFCAICAAALGLYQVYVGFLPAEQEWVDKYGYNALSVNGTIRPFSFFASSAEYAALLGTAIGLCWAKFLSRNFVGLLPLPVLVWGLFLTSSRTPVIITIAACAVLVAIQGRDARAWIPRLAVVMLLTCAGLAWSLKGLSGIDSGNSSENLVGHQVEGLLDPYGHKNSTADMHQNLILGGFNAGLHTPWGHGLGYTTMAAAKFGEGGGSTEWDFTDMIVSLGIVGGGLYIAIIVVVLSVALREWNRQRTSIHLEILAVTLAGLTGWTISGRYSTTMLLWVCIGAMDRLYARSNPKVDRAVSLSRNRRGW